jgi:putative MATE family efflux protein
MTHRELSRRIFMIALPASLQFMVSYVQVSTDMAFIGHYNTAGLSAIQNVRASFFLLLSFFLAFANGTNILIAQALGARRRRRASRIAEVSLLYNQGLSLAYLIFWQLGGYTLLRVMGAQGDVLAMGWSYVRILSLIFGMQGLILTANATFQGRGKTFPITLAAVLRAVLNIPLDWCLIYGRWGFPEMGITGAAIATLFSEIVGGGFLLVLLFRDKDFPVTLRHVGRPLFWLYRKVVALGLPNGVEFMLWSIGNTGIIALLNRLNPQAAGYFGVMHTLKIMNLSIYFGLGVATMTLVGMAVGAKDHALARRSGMLPLYFALGVCVVMGLVFVLFPRPMLGIFINVPAMVDELAPLLGIVSLTLFPQAVNVIIGNSMRGRGEVHWLLKVQIAGVSVILPLAYLAMFHFRLGFAGLLWVIFFDESWRSAANLLRLRVLFRRERQRLES